MVSEEGWGMEALSRGSGWGGAPAPIDILRWPENVPLEGVRFCAAHHPAHQGVIPTGGGCFGEILHLVPFQEIYRGSPGVRDHPPARQAGGAGDSKPDSV